MKKSALGCFACAAVVLSLWAAQGRHIATMTAELVESTELDEFGDEAVTARWQPTLRIGFFDLAAPSSAVMGASGVALLLWSRRRAKHL